MKLSWKKEKISDMVKIRVFIPHLELKEIFEDVVKKLPQYETIQIEQQYSEHRMIWPNMAMQMCWSRGA